jgi:energy-coupling factor transport system substrate-specific component
MTPLAENRAVSRSVPAEPSPVGLDGLRGGDEAVAAAPPQGQRKRRTFRWPTSELVAIGVFAALVRVVGLAIALAGGGMNPLTLILRNTAATALLVVLLHKSPRSGTLGLFVIIYGLLSVLLMGSGVMTLPGTLLAALVVDVGMACLGGYGSTWRILLAVGAFDLLTRSVSMVIGYVAVRESPAMFYMALGIVGLAYVGCLIGLGVGAAMVRELREAGAIRQ